jgi:hypothetical protein
MKLRPELISILLLFSCVYDPPQKGKEIFIHNQTDKPLIIIDSLTAFQTKLYDTATVNGRIYISRETNYMTEYDLYSKILSDFELEDLKNKKINKITIYIIDTGALRDTSSQITVNRSFDINIDTLIKYDLNHLFIIKDTILLEHDYSYFTNRDKR